jgi:hypothetical protein
MAQKPCFQSREVTGGCDVCKRPSTLMHLPLQPLGFYCEKHCPVCSTRCDTTREGDHRRCGIPALLRQPRGQSSGGKAPRP